MPAANVESVLALFVIMAAVRDLLARTIPNRLVLCGLASALALHALSGAPWHVLSTGLAGAGVGLLLFLPMYLQRAMAAGDVKLLAMVGAFAGPAQVCAIAMSTCCIGGLMALGIALCRGQLPRLLANTWHLLRLLLLRMAGVPLAREPMASTSLGGMPYGVAIALGTLSDLWLGGH